MAIDPELGITKTEYEPNNTTLETESKHNGEVYATHGETQRGIKSRHAQMLAIGGAIGTGLFVGTGQALAIGGPGPLLLSYCIICMMAYGIFTATGEMSSYLPVPGCSIAYFANRFVSKSLGFAMGWLYWYSFSIITAYGVTAAALVINYWPNNVPIAVWISVMLFVIVGLNLLPVRYYGETEFWFASLKVFMILGLLILSVVLCLGGGPNHQRLGFHYWNDPGPWKEYLVSGASGRFCSFLYVICFSVFSFVFAPELFVIAAGEMKRPRKNLPTAMKRCFYRLVIFYVLGVIAIGVICDSNAQGLTNGGEGASASPWTIAIKEAGIKGLDSVINAVIITSAWSSGNSYLYMATRSLYSLSMAGNAPRVFSNCTKWGIPYNALLASCTIALLAYMSCGSGSSAVFNWFVSLTNMAGFISWSCVGIIYHRFRGACRAQGVNVPYRSKFQPYLAYFDSSMSALLCLCNGFDNFFPGRWSVSSFLTSYVGLPIFLCIYFSHRIYTHLEPWSIPLGNIDLHTDLSEIIAMEEEEEANEPVRRSGWKARMKVIWD
ncbi:hypothetical protein FE257_009848 [Aspergillus nanangensis]|uniref:Amino acid permease/ SLC12A domain-containing protein n=1 Tax=Aspergillus nanangensis TaxID=2582783 RepID=A0AAD4GYE7_ASPNN|nr:hypothetical protein FE257_009848 [Aspergillus nanangensis]